MTTPIGPDPAPRSAAAAAAPRPADAEGQLAKYESQLSDWVHCPSSTTPAGKTKIAEIRDRIDTLKAQIRTSDAARTPARATPSAPSPTRAPDPPDLRFDGLGTVVDLRA